MVLEVIFMTELEGEVDVNAILADIARRRRGLSSDERIFGNRGRATQVEMTQLAGRCSRMDLLAAELGIKVTVHNRAERPEGVTVE